MIRHAITVTCVFLLTNCICLYCDGRIYLYIFHKIVILLYLYLKSTDFYELLCLQA